jgi:hypothetical protein
MKRIEILHIIVYDGGSIVSHAPGATMAQENGSNACAESGPQGLYKNPLRQENLHGHYLQVIYLLLLLAHFWPYSTMDVAKLAVQHARIACFTTQMLSTAATFLLVTDNAEVRIKAPFHQRMRWKKFVLNSQNRPLFRRHVRMTYSSFSKFLLDQIKVLIDVDDDMAYKRGGGNNSGNTPLRYNPVPCRCLLFGYMYLLWHLFAIFLFHCMANHKGNKTTPSKSNSRRWRRSVQ